MNVAQIRLAYGKNLLELEYDDSYFDVLGDEKIEKPLSDIEVNQKFDNPIQSTPPEDLVNTGDKVLIVVPDATRKSASDQVVNLLVRRLIAAGVEPHRMGIIFATGIHRSVTEEEKKNLLTPFIAQRIKTFNHSAYDLMKIAGLESKRFADFGLTKTGIRIEVNRLLLDFDRVFLIGGVTFHYFAGFTGGRKLICPGLASAETILQTHKLAFDCAEKDRRKGVGAGILKGNLVHETFVEIAEKVKPSFSINTIVDQTGAAIDVFCGHWLISHEEACDYYLKRHLINIEEKRDFVIVSCGGFPLDLNMIQAHKALEAASYACNDGGTIVLLAECNNGLGKSDFLKWFEAANSGELADKLCESYEVNGQTAWSLLKKTERFKVKIMTELEDEICRKMRMEKIKSLDGVIPPKTKGYIMPHGAKFLVRI